MTMQDKQKHFEGLKAADPNAIRLLSRRLDQYIPTLQGIYLLQKQDIEELRNDVILLTLQKLQDGAFQFRDLELVSYALAVARKLLANRLRKRSLDTVPLENYDGVDDLNPERYYLMKEFESKIGSLLSSLGENCEKTIRLKYYDNLKDQEVIDRKLTNYNSVDSLKNKRSQCLKKLATLAMTQYSAFSKLLEH